MGRCGVAGIVLAWMVGRRGWRRGAGRVVVSGFNRHRLTEELASCPVPGGTGPCRMLCARNFIAFSFESASIQSKGVRPFNI